MRMRDALERDIGIELAELELEWDKKVAGATLYQPKSTCCTPKGDVDEASMAAEAAEQRITQALQKELEKVDKECMRPLQVRAFRCCASCAEDRTSSAEVVGQCVQRCMQPMVEAEQQAKQEVQQLQERLSRCAKQCEDQARDSLPPIGTPSLDQEMKAKKSMEDCLIKCCDTHEKLIPKLASRLRGSLGNC